ncbi:MAG: hypothetical protein ABIM24_03805 [Paraperlucidibaca sp.]
MLAYGIVDSLQNILPRDSPMNKALHVLALATIATLTACDSKGKSETTVIERETIREVQTAAPAVSEAEKDAPKGDSLSISVGNDGSSVEIHAEGK